jgi:hypothetical protein
MGALTFGFQSFMKIHCSLVLDVLDIFNIMCTWILLELLVTKFFLFENNVIEKNYNMTFVSKMIINMLSLVAIRWSSFHPPSCIKS